MQNSRDSGGRRNKESSGNGRAESKNLSVPEVVSRFEPAYRNVYRDRKEIFNYNQDGSAFYRMSEKQVVLELIRKALEIGLDHTKVREFAEGCDIWNYLTAEQQKWIMSEFPSDSDLYFPGPIHIVNTLVSRHHIKTIPEIGTDKENVYCFNGQIYERGEELIKEEAHKEFLAQVREMLSKAEDEGENAKGLQSRLKAFLDRGPTMNDINEVSAMIRRTTFTSEEMNPDGYIPFKNGLMNLQTRHLEPFSPDKFYTYQIAANCLSTYITLKNVPRFWAHLNTTFFETDIPIVLSYHAYSLFPGFPKHKVLLVIGPPRIGKGVDARLIQGLMPKGTGSISLSALLTAERFYYQGIEGKNLLIDADPDRTFKRGVKLAWSRFTKLFGGDILSVEEKGKRSRDYISKAKGWILANLPFMIVIDPAAVTRFIVVRTRNKIPEREIPDLEKVILADERDAIATLLMQVLFKLIDRNFVFPGQMTEEATTELLEKLADPVENFIEDVIEDADDAQLQVDEAFISFQKWCADVGIIPLKRQTFMSRFREFYKKKRLGPRGKQDYYFLGCSISDARKEDLLSSWIHEESPGTTGIPDSGKQYRRIQHVRIFPPYNEGINGNDHEKGVNEQKSDTEINAPQSSISGGLAETNRYPTSKSDNSMEGMIPSYKSPDLVLRNLKEWGFDVVEYEKVVMSRDEWKARINGVFESFPEDKQQYLDKMFDVIFKGSSNTPYTWIRFRVKDTGS